jgi:TonB family protein
MRTTSHALIRVGFVLLAALVAVWSARAQSSFMDPAAAQIASAIVHAKQQSVIVFDFSGPGDKVTLLGQVLADDFSAALARTGSPLQIESRHIREEGPAANLYVPDIVIDPESTLMLAQQLRVKSFVMGKLSLDGGKLLLYLDSYRTSNGKGIKGLQVSWQASPEMHTMLGKQLTDFPYAGGDENTVAKSGEKGYTSPRCLQCPRADYSQPALDRKIQGVVELMAIVGTDGSVHVVHVVKGLPGGLTQEAIATVNKWKLAPALGPDGNPATVRQHIEVTFQLY